MTTTMTEPLEPARHDDPEGAEKGWSAKDFGPDDYADEHEVDSATTLISDGSG